MDSQEISSINAGKNPVFHPCLILRPLFGAVFLGIELVVHNSSIPNWFLHIESSACLEVDEDDFIYYVRRDGFIKIKLDYNF